MTTNNIRKAAEAATRHDNIMNEGGYGFNPHMAVHAQVVHDAVEAKMVSLMERSTEIRAAWNKAVAKYSVNGNLACTDLSKIESEVGVTLNEIKMLKTRMGW